MIGQYAKAIVAGVGALVAWLAANIEITDSSIIIPMTPEAAGMAAGALALVYGVWRVPNKPQDNARAK